MNLLVLLIALAEPKVVSRLDLTQCNLTPDISGQLSFPLVAPKILL